MSGRPCSVCGLALTPAEKAAMDADTDFVEHHGHTIGRRTFEELRDAASVTDDRGVVEVLDHEVYTRAYLSRPIRVITCGACHRMWDDAVATAWTPAPSGRCPFESEHRPPVYTRDFPVDLGDSA